MLVFAFFFVLKYFCIKLEVLFGTLFLYDFVKFCF
jgi:hypothetical protein